MMTEGDEKRLEEILEVDDNALTLREIEYIAKSDEVRKRYEHSYGKPLYSKILMSLTHETYSETEAVTLWEEILNHLSTLNKILNRDVGVSVATLDYLSNIRQSLSEPKIIEQDKSTFVSRATTIDELTTLYLRDVFDVILNKLIDKSKRTKNPFCLMMIDIDDFKKINDRYGHLIGDKVLNRIGACVNESIREMDLAARYGGEELAVIMPNSNIVDAHQAAERIRKSIEQLPFDGFRITVSIGISTTTALTDTSEKLIQSADNALYEAKHKGKNRVSIADETSVI